MTNHTMQPTRRTLLKWLGGVPLLPLGASASATLLAACGSSGDTKPATAAKLARSAFTGMAAPTLADPAAMATTTVSSRLTLEWNDGSRQEYQLGYRPLFQTGDRVPALGGGETIAGGYYDIHNRPILDRSVPGQERQFFSDCPDGSSLIQLEHAQVDGVAHPVFHVVQFEYTTKDLANNDMYARLPSPIAVLTLDQDPQNGRLTLKKYHNVDTSQVHGLWITCGASLSPWNTHLSSEEYEPDAFGQGVGTTLEELRDFSRNLYGSETAAHPYNYGHLPEVTVHPDGTGSIKKHYCMGRISHELVQVMPDERTVLMGDDYTNGALFLFIADRPRDLSSGTLYAAQYRDELNETSTARIQWLRLGHADSATIEALINARNIRPEHIFESLTEDPNDSSYTRITLSKKDLWVKLRPANNGFTAQEIELAAAFLETHRYAALKGASMAFTKMEGTTVNPQDKVAYSALANIQDSMVKGGKGWVKAHNVAFANTLKAGGILAHDLTGGQHDDHGQPLASDWAPRQSRMLLMGRDIPADSLGNTADPDTIASPDNLKYSAALRTLFIGEDSGNHVNNFLWAYQVDTGTLTRLLSTPAGAESTGLHAVDSINGWTYIMSNFQHAGDWSKLHGKVKDTLAPLVEANYKGGYAASVGYLTADIQPSTEKKAHA